MKNRKAFTMLEFIFFMVFFGVVSAMLIPKLAAMGWI